MKIKNPFFVCFPLISGLVFMPVFEGMLWVLIGHQTIVAAIDHLSRIPTWHFILYSFPFLGLSGVVFIAQYEWGHSKKKLWIIIITGFVCLILNFIVSILIQHTSEPELIPTLFDMRIGNRSTAPAGALLFTIVPAVFAAIWEKL